MRRERLFQQSLLAQLWDRGERVGAQSDPVARMGPARLSCLQLTKFAVGTKKKKCSPDPSSSDGYFQERRAAFDVSERALTMHIRWGSPQHPLQTCGERADLESCSFFALSAVACPYGGRGRASQSRQTFLGARAAGSHGRRCLLRIAALLCTRAPCESCLPRAEQGGDAGGGQQRRSCSPCTSSDLWELV